MIWQTVIGLEVHAQLKTHSKLFSSASTIFGAMPNTQTSYVDAGLPGVLPVLNEQAVRLAIRFGFAIQATVNQNSYFERKSYFYPDLPKGYQISQFKYPIVSNGSLEILLDEQRTKEVTIIRAHLEEDAGKSLHELRSHETGIDLNRAGMPLLEIVTSPCLYSANEAVSYLKTLHELLRFLDICDGNMQEGSFRCDVNLSLRPEGQAKLGTRTEIKNLNSFKFIEKAILYETARHQTLLESQHTIRQETRLYCPDTDTTQAMRSKEDENDYRYFPDPDLPSIVISSELLQEIKASMTDNPALIRKRLQQDSTLHTEDIFFLLSSAALFHYYEEVEALTKANAKTLVNWLKNEYVVFLQAEQISIEKGPLSAIQFARFLDKVHDKTLSHQNAKIVFTALLKGQQSLEQLIAEQTKHLASQHTLIDSAIEMVITTYPAQIAEYQSGKEKILGFLVGQVLKKMKGQADASMVNKLLREKLKK